MGAHTAAAARRAAVRQPSSVLRRARATDAHGADRPLAGYLALIGTYLVAATGVTVAARRTGRHLPATVTPGDVVLLTAATFRISRLLAKDTVTSPLRSPFTEFQEAAGEGEVNERPRGSGLRHAAGELVSCPFCTSVWTVTGLTAGLAFAPRFTRWVAAAATAVAGADFLQLAYARMRHLSHQR
jgi:hypothetical protein